ncbi:hypothetical protein QBC44DRAFT_85626 [Cladorrhinum sp. PSN332]|nr:hypothetical protein QBC44DRAFT_85626 [Cladorrhinum sp. PSN332]
MPQSRALPTIPFIILGIFEPALLLYSYLIHIHSPWAYYSIQAPQSPLPPIPSAASFPAQAEGTTIQLVNLFIVLSIAGAFCSFSKDAVTVKGFLVAYGIGDFGHIWAIYKALGPVAFWDTGVWNEAVWGGMGVSVLFAVTRWGTLAGLFGRVGGREPEVGKGKGE